MDFLKNNARGIVIALLAVGVITAVSASGSNDDDQTDNQPEVSQTDTANEPTGPLAPETDEESSSAEEPSAFNEDGERESAAIETNEGTFSTAARSGDNQTVLVRDIVSQYVEGSDTSLSAEQLLYVETNLVQNLPANDLIFVGDELSVTESDLDAVVAAAGDLTEAELAMWATYL